MKASRTHEFAHAALLLLRDTGELVISPVIDMYATARSAGESRLKAASIAAVPAAVILAPAMAGGYFGVPKTGIACSLAYGAVIALTEMDDPGAALRRTRARMRHLTVRL